jgi:uncharacterized membrane protein
VKSPYINLAVHAMQKTLLAYAATTLVMVAIDLVWLGLIAKPIYQQGIGHLMAEQPKLAAGAVFYLLYPVGLMVFAVVPGASLPWSDTALKAALFGFIAYATYDLTNLATLKNWPTSLALIDMAWGTGVSVVAALAGRWAYQAAA